MTVENEDTPRVQTAGNGATTAFAFGYVVLEDDDVLVTLTDGNGDAVSATLDGLGTYDYSISGTYDDDYQGYLSGVNVNFNTAPPSGYTVTLTYDVERTQDHDYIDNDDFPANVHERALDKLMIIAQQLKEEIDRKIGFAVTSTQSDIPFPEPEASKYIRWNSAGTGLENVTVIDATEYTVTAIGEDIIEAANAAAVRALIDVEPGVDVQAFDADTLKADVSDELQVGFTTSVNAVGNSGTGTVTVDLTVECLQTLTVNGSFTFAPPSSENGVAVFIVTTDATGGYTITTSGFTVVNGSYDNTADKVHRFTVTKVGSVTILDIDEVS